MVIVMKKFLVVLLSIIMVLQAFMIVPVSAVTAAVWQEDFESYAVETNITAGTGNVWKVYEEDKNGYYKGGLNAENWMATGSGNNFTADTSSVGGTKALKITAWGTVGKYLEVSPNTEYKLTFKYYGTNSAAIDFSGYDSTGVNKYSYRAYTYDTPVLAANRIKAYNNDLLTRFFYDRSNSFTVNKWIDKTFEFETGEDTAAILLAFSCESAGDFYIDDIVLTSNVNPSVKVITEGENSTPGGVVNIETNPEDETDVTYKAFPYENARFTGWYKNGSLISTDPVINDTLNGNNNIEAHFYGFTKNYIQDGSFETIPVGTNYLYNTAFHWISGGDQKPHTVLDAENMVAMERYATSHSPVISSEMAYSGNKSLKIGKDTAGGNNAHRFFKLVNIEANKIYSLTYYYYQDKQILFGDDTGFQIIGLNMDAIKALKNPDPAGPETGEELVLTTDAKSGYYVDYTAKIDEEDVVVQRILNYQYYDKLGVGGVVGKWTKATIKFSSENFTTIAIPLGILKAEAEGHVYIDHMSLCEEEDFEPAYTIAVVGDTQKVNYLHSERLHEIFDDIIATKEERNTQFVMHMGDITDNNVEAEYLRAADEFKRLTAADLPYLFVRGNHDFLNNYTKYLKADDLCPTAIECYDGIRNCYQTLTVGSTNYLFLALDMGAPDDAIAWANKIISRYPDYSVVIATHAYLSDKTQMLVTGTHNSPTYSIYDGSNNAEVLWEDLFARHENIVMVACGHVNAMTGKVAIGNNGNDILQVIVNGQKFDTSDDPAGLVAYFGFSEDGSKISIEYYSTLQQKTWGKVIFNCPTYNKSFNTVTAKGCGGNVQINNDYIDSTATCRGNADDEVLLSAVPFSSEDKFLEWTDEKGEFISAEKSITVNPENQTVYAVFENAENTVLQNFENDSIAGDGYRTVNGVEYVVRNSETSAYSGHRMLALLNQNTNLKVLSFDVAKHTNYRLALKWFLPFVDGAASKIKEISVVDANGASLITKSNVESSGKWSDIVLSFNSNNTNEISLICEYEVEEKGVFGTDRLFIDDVSLSKLTTFTPGDINDDGAVDDKDISTLSKYLAGWDVSVNEAALDINKDGLIDDKDISYLAKNLAGWNGFELN